MPKRLEFAWRTHARFFVLVALIAVIFAGGGGSRADILSLLYVRPMAVVVLAITLLLPGEIQWRAIRVPLILLAALAILLLIQLVPLPPSIWTQLPEHALLKGAASAAGLSQPWRPMSIAPDETLNSLVSLIVPVAVLVGVAGLSWDKNRQLLPALIVAGLASALLGTAQISSGAGGPFYLYEITNENSAVGLFANRNHQAAFLAMIFPMLAVWATQVREKGPSNNVRAWVACALGLFLLLMIVVTGSRAGLVLGTIGLVSALLLFRAYFKTGHRRASSWTMKLLKVLPWVAAATILAMAVLLSRAEAIRRLLGTGGAEDLRIFNFPLLAEIAWKFMPVGSGFGTFDQVYRIYEPEEALRLRYLNHAHNDLLEVLITGGIPALLIALCFVGWWAVRSFRSVRERTGRTGTAFERLGAVILLLFLAASLVDYPLRTPTGAMIAAIACGWLCGLARGVRRESEYETGPEPRSGNALLYERARAR